MSRKYKNEYEKLGEERIQEFPALNRAKGTGTGNNQESEFECYWAVRKDEAWVLVPGIRRYVRKTKQLKFITTLPQILINLQPATTFNPYEVWEKELEAERKKAAIGTVGVVVKKKVLSKKEKMIQDNVDRISNESLVSEITKIRNTSRNELVNIIRDIKIKQARAVLFIQILYVAYDSYKEGKKAGMSNKKLLYEALWAIEEISPLPEFNAPKPTNPADILPGRVSNSGLVYDDFASVKKLQASAKQVMLKETDLRRLQLVDMSDSLPPLSKFNVGFKLDEWQKRVLRWIDAGKSVVICAPTSSGKTVLSSYVALIFKSAAMREKLQMEMKKEADEGGVKGGQAKADEKKKVKKEGDGDEDQFDEVVDDDDDEDSEGEEYNVVDLKIGDDYTTTAASSSAYTEDDDDEEDDSTEKRDHALIEEDRMARALFRTKLTDLTQEDFNLKVLFVVPTEPLVWQVAAYFTKLLLEVGQRETKVALITDQLTFNPNKRFGAVPQIVVGTPGAIETALTKPRGVVGMQEACLEKVEGRIIPGGFDHFDWVIYDEVHSLDGTEGDALQRLIRSMNCKFLALSATVGNAEELRGWMERVRGDQLYGVETVTVKDEVTAGVQKVAAVVEAVPEVEVTKAPVGESFQLTVVKTLSNETMVLTLSPEERETMTVLDLKEKTYERWPEVDNEPVAHARYPMQFKFNGIDFKDDSATLKSFNVFDEGTSSTVYMNLLVNLLMHQSRFINLQRYVWNGASNTLSTVNPIAAIQDVQSLQNGILGNSSLSFTSQDSFRLWEEISRIFPAEDVQHISPYTFFGAQERITLQRTKDYEDILKAGLKDIAAKFPIETLELLNKFAIIDQPSKEFDLCEMVLDLKKRDMIPCLPFHLSTFEAVRLFNQVLAGMEWRQKVEHPTYYMDLKKDKEKAKKDNDASVKSKGGNKKETEDAEKAGELDTSSADFTVDEFAPHPKFVLTKGNAITELELVDICDEMERFDGFEKRSNEDLKLRKGKHLGILQHALIRGLRRGIGLFINEVSFPSYRRAVQRLASKGKLAVVISDDSLAFGVNMPFRTCIFCGEMFNLLDELMAQQMSGRAGRRGLDTQGNVVYAGLRASSIRKIMIGKISNITGQLHIPRYETMFLQPVLSPRHVGWTRSKVMGGRTLLEHCDNVNERTAGSPDIIERSSSFTLEVSKAAMTDLGFITYDADQKRYIPDDENQMSYAMLAVVWYMRDQVHESIAVGLGLADIIEYFSPLVSTFSFQEKKSNTDKLEPLVFAMFVIMSCFINRTPYDPSDPDSVQVTDIPYFKQPQNMELLLTWQQRYEMIQLDRIPDQWENVRDPVAPGTVLDGRLLQCLLDRNYVHTLSFEFQQKMKAQIWHMGNTLMTLANCCWPEPDHEQLLYHRVSYFIFRTCFVKLRYLNSELIRKVIDFDDCSAMSREKRVEGAATSKSIARPPAAEVWSDNSIFEDDALEPTPWGAAVERCAERLQVFSKQTEEQSGSPPDSKAIYGESTRLLTIFGSTKPADRVLMEMLSTGDFMQKPMSAHLQEVASAVTKCSFASASPLHKIGALVWLCTRSKAAEGVAKRFPMYLKTMVDPDDENADKLIEETVIREWYNQTGITEGNYPLCTGNPIKAEEVDTLRKGCAMFIQWMDAQEEDDDEDDDEDEEEA